MKKIITITLNPAFDLHYSMEKFELKKENYVKKVLCDAGGKGINISRALTICGVHNIAYLVLGDENGAQFEHSLKSDGMDYVPIYVKGRVRENITIHPQGDKETRISLDNFSVSAEVLDKLYELLASKIDKDTLISFSGRIPKGITKDDAIAFLCRLKYHGGMLAIDSNSLTTNDLLQIHPYFIKPNEEEIVSFIGRSIENPKDAAECACEFVRSGLAEQVMISLGKDGSAWSDGTRRATVSIPAIECPISTIGAGDSTVAGYLAATAAGEDIESTLRCAAAFGTSACLTEGTRPPMLEDVKRIYDQVKVINL